ncbi:heavy metal translocating P-type ATPase [Baaleninema simplex]|uniref:heavy metal translocating P-type ATPase n=1 Tax=Baaleninema simplex TaxID=2862350 RepID=UPI00037A0E6D|nr:heavy metal translocating P-type ATPase [Baaleninema simplex]
MKTSAKPTTDCCSCHGTTDTHPASHQRKKRREIWLLAGVSLWFAVGLALTGNEVLTGIWTPAWFLPAYFIVGWDVLKTAGRHIVRGRAFDETFLMSVATLGAIAIDAAPEAVGVMLFYRIGEAVQEFAVDRSRNSIRSLLEVRPDVARVKTSEGFQSVSPEVVEVGTEIFIKPGERIPLDGEVLSGNSYLDTSALTGESVPRSVEAGDRVLAGTINQSGALTVRVTQPFGESSIVRILELVENARHQKAPTETFMRRFARRYTPFVVGLALAIATLPPLFLPEATFIEWGYRALILLVISCPCGLVISIPLGYFGGVGGAAKQGVLVKGSVFLDRLAELHTVVFDKTGTLTEGSFEVTQVRPADGWNAEEVLQWAALAESHSTHPIARSICRAVSDRTSEMTFEMTLSDYQEISGRGVRVTAADSEGIERAIAVGSDRLFESANFPPFASAGTGVRVAIDGRYIGDIVVSDRLREDAAATVSQLKQLGVDRMVMLTGDRRSVAESIAKAIGIDDVRAELLPEDKANALDEVFRDLASTETGTVAFVGDGINDAPAIARADVGVAMGGLGSDAAIETADVVLMSDAPSKLVDAVRFGRRTRRIVWQNIAIALGVKGIVILLGALGFATLWEAVFADVGVALIAIANATRALYRAE